MLDKNFYSKGNTTPNWKKFSLIIIFISLLTIPLGFFIIEKLTRPAVMVINLPEHKPDSVKISPPRKFINLYFIDENKYGMEVIENYKKGEIMLLDSNSRDSLIQINKNEVFNIKTNPKYFKNFVKLLSKITIIGASYVIDDFEEDEALRIESLQKHNKEDSIIQH